MTNEQIQLVLEIVSTVAVVFASGTAIYGINAWKKEFSGKRKIELAEEVLALFYEARDAISIIRSPFLYEGEDSKRKSQEDETQIQKEAKDLSCLVRKRFQKQQHVFNKLQSKQYQFMARFGYEKAKPFDDLRQMVLEILMSADELVPTMVKRERDVKNEEKLFKKETELMAVIRENQTVEDPIKLRLKEIISSIEVIYKPIILGKSK
jgi:hypothetical protein